MTRIKKLVMEGFKSFARRTELYFDQPFSVVLGANGSGKSNVMDALCFVLGKSSSKAMRAEKSANLIYNGGKTKKPAKYAEVSIFFDNASKEFPIEEDELKLTRIVKAHGVSTYRINNKTRTRGEIIELLSRAHIDPNGYNIILQGDIIRFIEMSSVERRGIIEEIAGISVYEEKKKKALNELTKVEEKLTEAGIILKERQGHLRELKKERDQAQKYKDLNDRINQNKATYAHFQIEKKKEEKKKFLKKHDKHASILKESQEDVRKKREHITTKKSTMDAISKEIENKGEKDQVVLQKKLEDIKITHATKKTRITVCTTELEKIRQKKGATQKNIQDITQKITSLKRQEEEIAQISKKKENIFQDIEKKIAQFKKKHKLDSNNELEKETDRLDQETETLQNTSSSAREQAQDLLREQDRIEFQLQTIDEKINKVLEVEKEHKQEIDILKKKKKEFNTLVLELNQLLNQDTADAKNISVLRQDLHSLRETAHSLEIKQAGIREAQQANIAIKKVLENKRALGEVYDVVSALGTVDDKYAAALEVAAGQKANAIVVGDDKTAAKCINYLKVNKLGVATFLPLNKVKSRPTDATIKTLAKKRGVYGFAVELIQYDPRFRNVFNYVFGSTIVVENINTARTIGIGNAKMVTLDGDLSETSGAMKGGFRQQRKTGRFGGGELQKKIDNTQEKVTRSESELHTLESKRSKNEERIVRVRELKATLEGDIIKTEKSLHLDSSDLLASQNYKKELQEKLKHIKEQRQATEKELSEFTKKIMQLKIKRQEVKNKIAELRNPRILAELHAFDQKRKELHEELSRHSTEIASVRIQRTDIHERDKENSKKILHDLDKEEEQFTKEQKEVKHIVKDLEKTITEREKEQAQFYKQFKTLFDKRNVLNNEVNLLEQQVLTLETNSRSEELTINSMSVELARIKAELSGLQAEYEQYGDVELALKKTEQELKQEINAHERIMANIGNVNMRALEIYDTVKEEYEKLLAKKETLEKEKEQVMSLMQEIEGQKNELFLEAFDVINKNFGSIFSKLSTKGAAYLKLENSEDPLSAGMLVKVKITGEKFLDIRSLSGGEKTLTTLAFIFAIQEHNPASFYLLDEVDAALDKKNSALLGQLVKQYCKKAQYILISHQDDLIRHADAMYGVTLRGDGSGQSAVVSLKT